MRITTNQIISNYQTGLNKAAVQMEIDRVKVMTGKAFQSVSEDPTNAAKAFNYRREYNETLSYMTNVSDLESKYEAVSDCAIQMNEMLKTATSEMLLAINGATSYESRQAYSASLTSLNESIVSTANTKFGDCFIFGGENVSYAPFKLNDDGFLEYTQNGTDYYTVSAEIPEGVDASDIDARSPIVDGATKIDVDEDGNPKIDPLTGEPIVIPDEETQAIYDALSSYANASVYVDLGFGLEYTSGDLVTNSVFDMSISGLDFLGYGNDEETGLSNNAVDLINEFALELQKEDPDMDYLRDVYTQFSEAASDFLDCTTSLGTKAEFLSTTSTRLEDLKFILEEKIVDTEEIDLAEAITNYSWSMYAYNQALKVGNSILGQSFIDFMR